MSSLPDLILIIRVERQLIIISWFTPKRIQQLCLLVHVYVISLHKFFYFLNLLRPIIQSNFFFHFKIKFPWVVAQHLMMLELRKFRKLFFWDFWSVFQCSITISNLWVTRICFWCVPNEFEYEETYWWRIKNQEGVGKIKAPNSSWIWFLSLEAFDILIPCSLYTTGSGVWEVSQRIYLPISNEKLNKSPKNSHSSLILWHKDDCHRLSISIYLISYSTSDLCCRCRLIPFEHATNE